MATAQNVIDRTRQLINDVASGFVSGLRWADAEMLLWLTDGQREIVVLEPEANPVTAVFDVVAGKPRQSLPAATAHKLIRVEANGSGSLVYGNVMTIVEKDVLDSFSSAFTTRTVADAPNPYKHYALDPVDSLAFWLDQPGLDARDVIVTYAGIPATLAAVGNNLTLSEMYVPHLVDYLAWRTLSKDARAGAKALGQAYRESFLMRLGAGRQVLRQAGQNAARAPEAEA